MIKQFIPPSIHVLLWFFLTTCYQKSFHILLFSQLFPYEFVIIVNVICVGWQYYCGLAMCVELIWAQLCWQSFWDALDRQTQWIDAGRGDCVLPQLLLMSPYTEREAYQHTHVCKCTLTAALFSLLKGFPGKAIN